MRTYYQVYRDGYWHTSTLDKAEAFSLAQLLRTKGHVAEVRVEGRSISEQKLHTCDVLRPNMLVPYSDGPCDACSIERG
jgi:hypothetical protein